MQLYAVFLDNQVGESNRYAAAFLSIETYASLSLLNSNVFFRSSDIELFAVYKKNVDINGKTII